MLFTISSRARGSIFSGLLPSKFFCEVQRIGVVCQAAPDSGIAAGDARGSEKASSFRAQNPFNSFVFGFG
jgi:hypothetical protein